MEVLRGVALVLATMTVGMMAGVFVLYAHTIMPGLGRTDDRTFVGAFQAIDRAIINPLFMVTFGGALVFTVLAALFSLGAGRPAPWILVALGLYLAVVVVTIAVNVPLNDGIKAAGDPDRVDLAAVRERFDQARWVRWNLFRAVASTAAFACLAWALVLHGRPPGGA